MDNPLSRLSLDRWYKVFIAAGFAVFILVGTGALKLFPILPTVSISLGFFFVGLGEWINHPLQTRIRSADAFFPAGVISGYPRNACFLGCFWDVVGVLLLIVGVFGLFS